MKKNVFIAVIVILVVWLLILSIALFDSYHSNDVSNEINEYNVTGFSTDFTKVVEESKTSIVSLNQNDVYSSGFIFSSNDGKVYIVSCYHGVSENENVTIYFNSGVSVEGRVLGSDIFADVALIECDFNYEVRPVIIGDSTLLNDGEFVLSIGTSSSIDYDFSTNFGMISSSYREIENNITFDGRNYSYYLGSIQLSGDFKEGYSGAPIINMNGEVVGMITMEDDGNTFAITINEIKEIAEKILNNEEYTRIDFGLKGRYINALENYEIANLNIGLEVTSGYYIDELKVNGFGSSLGLLKGDIITNINNVDINGFDDMLDVIYSNEKEFNLIVIRNNETINLQGTLYD